MIKEEIENVPAGEETGKRRRKAMRKLASDLEALAKRVRDHEWEVNGIREDLFRTQTALLDMCRERPQDRYKLDCCLLSAMESFYRFDPRIPPAARDFCIRESITEELVRAIQRAVEVVGTAGRPWMTYVEEGPVGGTEKWVEVHFAGQRREKKEWAEQQWREQNEKGSPVRVHVFFESDDEEQSG